MSTASINERRNREKGVLVYPAHSRRSGGLSLGINLFPDRKLCSFDCPYCEVFPFGTDCQYSLPLMESALEETLKWALVQGLAVKDICFSGNGEPSLSPHFPAALEAAFRIRDKSAPEAGLVLITNGTGLLDGKIYDLLRRSALRGLDIWLKFDAGTESWYRAMNRCDIPYGQLLEKIRAFVKDATLVLQTMICAIRGEAPPNEESRAWETAVIELAGSALNLKGVQIYGKARPAPEDPLAEALPERFLEERAASLRKALESSGKITPVLVYP